MGILLINRVHFELKIVAHTSIFGLQWNKLEIRVKEHWSIAHSSVDKATLDPVSASVMAGWDRGNQLQLREKLLVNSISFMRSRTD